MEFSTFKISKFAPLLDQIRDGYLTGAISTVVAPQAQRAHAIYLVEQRHAHYLITIKDNQPALAAQPRRLPWKRVPVPHRQTNRGHRRHEIRAATKCRSSSPPGPGIGYRETSTL